MFKFIFNVKCFCINLQRCKRCCFRSITALDCCNAMNILLEYSESMLCSIIFILLLCCTVAIVASVLSQHLYPETEGRFQISTKQIIQNNCQMNWLTRNIRRDMSALIHRKLKLLFSALVVTLFLFRLC